MPPKRERKFFRQFARTHTRADRARLLVEAEFEAKQRREAERLARSKKNVQALLKCVLGRLPFETDVELTAEETESALSNLPSSLRAAHFQIITNTPVQARPATNAELVWAYRLVERVEERLDTTGEQSNVECPA